MATGNVPTPLATSGRGRSGIGALSGFGPFYLFPPFFNAFVLLLANPFVLK
ncbi:hypothetical protein FAES_2217 [Fibrella aestuarina BUZ 2]|uniref:Uncharacterized protein n=1 Tax=Fibrella aestuarina BUZ 2 TaxID=1166018 RepID=I0K7X3_9BACT|nr:hypothetical protein FAES_2217 [Fibrella aestuarina BUZ 2]